MILDLLKNIFKLNIKQIEVGDIIIAKRYNNIFQKYKIKKGHRIGPYIIVYKKGKKLYALTCTSSNKESNIYLKLNNKYNFDKQTYVNLKDYKRIKCRQFIKTIDKLDKKDLNEISKKCKQLNIQ